MSSVPQASTNLLASASLYVGDLSPDVPEAKLYEIFNNIGQVQSVRVLRDVNTRRSLGYAYVNFHRVDDAEKALEIWNYKEIGGRPCRIMWSQRNPELRRSGKGNIFVKNLAKEIDHEALRDTFSRFGTILSCKVATNSRGESLGYGFVHFQDEAQAATAVAECSGRQIGSNVVTVAPFVAKVNRGGGAKFTNIYVKSIPRDITEDAFQKMFAEYGKITSSKLNVTQDETKTNFGFINFTTHEEAKAAIEGLNNKEIGDKRLFVARAQKREERIKELKERHEQAKAERQLKYQGVNLYIKNLPDAYSEAKLRALFAEFGEITSATVMIDAKTKKSKGFGFVCFSTPEEAMRAVGLNGSMIEGKPLYVAMAQRLADRRQQIEQNMARRHMAKNQVPIYANATFAMPNPRMYPNQPMQWAPNQPVPMHMGPRPGPYQLVQAATGGRGGPRPNRGGRGGNRGQQRFPQQGQQRFNENVRNQRGHPQQQPPQQQQAPPVPLEQLSTKDFAKAVAALPDDKRKPAFGERLYPLVHAQRPTMAPKITGMLLEMEDPEIIELLDNNESLLKKIEEALQVLQESASEQA